MFFFANIQFKIAQKDSLIKFGYYRGLSVGTVPMDKMHPVGTLTFS